MNSWIELLLTKASTFRLKENVKEHRTLYPLRAYGFSVVRKKEEEKKSEIVWNNHSTLLK